MTPYRFISPSGTTTWLFNVTSFGPGASILEKETNDTNISKQAAEILLTSNSKKQKGLQAIMAKLDLNLDKFGKEVKEGDSCDLDTDEQRHSAYLIMTEEFP